MSRPRLAQLRALGRIDMKKAYSPWPNPMHIGQVELTSVLWTRPISQVKPKAHTIVGLRIWLTQKKRGRPAG